MKKTLVMIALTLTLGLSFGLTACGDGENTPAGSPSAPKNLTAINTYDQVIRDNQSILICNVILTWPEPSDKGESDIIRYEVSKDNGDTWTDVGLACTYTFTELTAGAEYIFRVRAVNEQGAGKSRSVSVVA